MNVLRLHPTLTSQNIIADSVKEETMDRPSIVSSVAYNDTAITVRVQLVPNSDTNGKKQLRSTIAAFTDKLMFVQS